MEGTNDCLGAQCDVSMLEIKMLIDTEAIQLWFKLNYLFCQGKYWQQYPVSTVAALLTELLSRNRVPERWHLLRARELR